MKVGVYEIQGLGFSLDAQSKTVASFSSVEVNDKQRKRPTSSLSV